jgi:hypothetical protein
MLKYFSRMTKVEQLVQNNYDVRVEKSEVY